MKRIALVCCLSSGALMLAACASTQSSLSSDQRISGSLETTQVVNEGYVAAVEREARKRGVDVTWVNPPTNRVTRPKKNGE